MDICTFICIDKPYCPVEIGLLGEVFYCTIHTVKFTMNNSHFYCTIHNERKINHIYTFILANDLCMCCVYI